MLTRTLAQMRDAVQRTADVVAFVDKHPVTYLNDLINRGIAQLSRLCLTTNPEFRPIASTAITADGTNTDYALPSNFRTLLMVEYVHDGRKFWLEEWALNEHADLTSQEVQDNALCADSYRVIGTNISLLPKPAQGDIATLWFATSAQQLVNDSDTYDTFERLDQYIVWWAAREIASERENWERVDRLTQRLGELEGDIRILARSVDLGAPARIADDRQANPYDRYGRRVSRLRSRW